MNRILWIGDRNGSDVVARAFDDGQTELCAFDDVETALRETHFLPVAVGVISADTSEAAMAIARLRDARPTIEIIVATRLGVPIHLSTVLQAGATGVLDLRIPGAGEMSQSLQRALGRHRQRAKERELLTRLHALNEEFLKNVIGLEKRNLELEHRLGVTVDPTGTDGAYRVLVIDDEPSVLKLFSLMFEDGYELTTCDTGEAGIAAFQRKPFALVVTDKNLPGIDGHEVMRRVRELQPTTEVIIISGYASKQSAITALNAGAVAYLEKPFDDVGRVKSTINDLIEKQRERDRKRHYLTVIKQRNKEFLDRYRAIRSDLEGWLMGGEPGPGDSGLGQ